MTPNLQSLISQMTLEEKAALCTGASRWTSTPIERLGIPEFLCSDGPHGLRRLANINSVGDISLPATAFPTASCLASSWDVELVGRVGAALAEECIAQKVDMLLGPGVNMKRSPLGGRNFEYFSEDPYLAGEMAVHYINSLQSRGVGASLKHFAVNNQEYQRFNIDAQVDERSLREIYLPAFEKAVKQTQPWSVMCAYNKVNGTLASQHETLLTDILKKEWGFEGLVVSDWNAVWDRVAALQAGLDWQMPGPKELHVEAVVNAVRSGELNEAILDESVRRILRIVFMGAETPKGGSFDAAAHNLLARQAAAESMVLLKNNGILPLTNPASLAVIGLAAKQAHYQGRGSSFINPTRVTVPLDELIARAGNSSVVYAEGYPADNTFRQDLIDAAVNAARAAEVAILFLALPGFKESEGYDREDLDLTAQQVALVEAVSQAQPRTVVVLNNGAPLVMPWLDGVSAVLEAYLMGQAGGAALADIIFGLANPCGKLAETFPIKLEDVPSHGNWPGSLGVVRYGEGLYIGYRYYDLKRMPVQFAFGHGLSYTSFDYSNARVSANEFKDVDGLTVSLDITNSGAMAGKEIVQVYVHDHESGLERPYKELKGFAKVELQPGETRTCAIPLDFRAFAYYHPKYKQWITEDGRIDILIGASCADIRQVLTVRLISTLELPCILDKESTFNEWMIDPRGRQALAPLQESMQQGINHLYGTGNRTLINATESLKNNPLYSMLMRVERFLPKKAEEMLADLLAQVQKLS
jgi:beta-glucosidase